jgi:hypothetical protein
MNDRELEELLRRYRPAGPPADLRARVMSGAVPVGRTWPWVAAAAVLLAATLWLHTAADRLGASVGANTLPDSEQEAIALLANMLGGHPGAREVAEAAIMLDTMPSDPGSGRSPFLDGSQTQ